MHEAGDIAKHSAKDAIIKEGADRPLFRIVLIKVCPASGPALHNKIIFVLQAIGRKAPARHRTDQLFEQLDNFDSLLVLKSSFSMIYSFRFFRSFAGTGMYVFFPKKRVLCLSISIINPKFRLSNSETRQTCFLPMKNAKNRCYDCIFRFCKVDHFTKLS